MENSFKIVKLNGLEYLKVNYLNEMNSSCVDYIKISEIISISCTNKIVYTQTKNNITYKYYDLNIEELNQLFN